MSLHIVVTRIKYMVYGARGGRACYILDKGVACRKGHFDGKMLSSEVKQIFTDGRGDESTLRPFGKAFYHGQSFLLSCPDLIIIFMHARS
jgi:hypothetical protein